MVCDAQGYHHSGITPRGIQVAGYNREGQSYASSPAQPWGKWDAGPCSWVSRFSPGPSPGPAPECLTRSCIPALDSSGVLFLCLLSEAKSRGRSPYLCPGYQRHRARSRERPLVPLVAPDGDQGACQGSGQRGRSGVKVWATVVDVVAHLVPAGPGGCFHGSVVGVEPKVLSTLEGTMTRPDTVSQGMRSVPRCCELSSWGLRAPPAQGGAPHTGLPSVEWCDQTPQHSREPGF